MDGLRLLGRLQFEEFQVGPEVLILLQELRRKGMEEGKEEGPRTRKQCAYMPLNSIFVSYGVVMNSDDNTKSVVGGDRPFGEAV